MNSEPEIVVTRFDCSIPHPLNMGLRLPIHDFLKQISDATNCIIGERVAEVLAADERVRNFNTSFFTSTGAHLGLSGQVPYRTLLRQALTKGNALSAMESAYILGNLYHGLPDDFILSIMCPVKLKDDGEYVIVSRMNQDNRLCLCALDVNNANVWDTRRALIRGGLNVGMQLRPGVDPRIVGQLT